jgi:hypothetical protein
MSSLLRSSRTTAPFRQLLSFIVQGRGIATSPIAMAPSISDAIKKDHREIESYYDKIVASSDSQEQVRFQNLFTWELARHSIGEELVVYPVFEKLLSGGVDMANKDRKEHLKVSRTVSLTNNDANVMHSGQRAIEGLPEHDTFQYAVYPYSQRTNGEPFQAHQRGRE